MTLPSSPGGRLGGAAAAGIVAGFYGKLPARGDFVSAGLPRDFTDRWDAWLQSVIGGSRILLGDGWLPAFLEAPVWRFALSAGLCGDRAVVGLFLPSVDKAGRYFPLTFAALHSGGVGPEASVAEWLDRCEAAGLAALQEDASPELVSAMLGRPDLQDGVGSLAAGSVWWSEGSPRVSPQRFQVAGMPDRARFASMLVDKDGDRGHTADERDEPEAAIDGPSQEGAGEIR